MEDDPGIVLAGGICIRRDVRRVDVLVRIARRNDGRESTIG